MDKKCSCCRQYKTIDQFYKAGNNRKGYQAKCIICYNQVRKDLRTNKKLNKPNPFQKLGKELQDDIMRMVAHKYDHKEICITCGINYFTFRSWKKYGFLPKCSDYYGINLNALNTLK